MADNTLDMINLLANAGEATSPKDSPAGNLGAAVGEMATNEQGRQYLSDLLSGVPDPTGRFGLDPQTIISGLKLKQQIQAAQPEQVQMSQVETPWGTETMPAEEVPDYRLKLHKEQNESTPNSIKTFQAYQKMDDKTKKSFDEFSKKQRGKSFEQVMAEFLAKQKASAKQQKELEAELELGTAAHYEDVKGRYDDADLSDMYNNYSARRKKAGKSSPSAREFREQFFLHEMAKEIEDRRDDVNDVIYKDGNEGVGFYGTTDEGKEILIQKFQGGSQ